MSYAGKFLKSRGQDCIIERVVPTSTKVSIKRSTKASRDLGVREGYWEGFIFSDVGLVSGEIITIRNSKYLVQSSNYDHASTETAFFAAKCNAVIQHKRFVEDTDEFNNVVQEWQIINADVSAYSEIVTSKLRQEDPGLLDSAKYTFQVAKSFGVVMLDRFIFSDDNYQVASIDSTGLAGVDRIQVETDTRPD